MKIGVNKTIISPQFEVDLAGFANPDRKSAGIHDDIHVSVMVMEHCGKKAAIICADIIGFDMEMVKEMKNTLNHKFGFSDEELLFNASHTHSGPQTLNQMLDIVGKASGKYLSYLNNKLISAFEAALNNLEDAELFISVIKSNIGINRRLISEGKALFAPNEDGKTDDDVTILKFSTNNRVKAIMFNYACHPSMVSTKYISADYPGRAKKVIEDHFGNGAIAFFLQGCCGDIRARIMKDGKFVAGTWEDIDKYSDILGHNIVAACQGSMLKVENIDIKTAITHINLPLEKIPEKVYYEGAKLDNALGRRDWAGKMLQNYEKLHNSRPFIIQRISLANKLVIIGMSGEVCSEYSLFIKGLLPGAIVIPAGYTNGTEGYIPTENMFEEGGYEPDGSYIFFSFPSRYDSSIELTLKQHIEKIIAE